MICTRLFMSCLFPVDFPAMTYCQDDNLAFRCIEYDTPIANTQTQCCVAFQALYLVSLSERVESER